jgi:lipopolysaccharide transport system ATP-binding protein
MRQDCSIEIRNLTKKYDINQINYLTFFGKNNYINAISNISADILTGDRVGVVGLNGSGKTTLLKIISRVTYPTDGYVKIRGKVSSILEAGAGFQPDLTGLENIFISGAVLGMNRLRINKKLSSIVEFSELKDFINTPVKKYSSGMQIKLAFAISSYLDGDIFILDEVLAFADDRFKKKCFQRIMSRSIKEKKTIMIVSHDIEHIATLCNKIILLKNGILKMFGDTNEILKEYKKNLDT